MFPDGLASGGMADRESFGGAGFGGPTGADAGAAAAGVEAEAADGHEDVPAPGENGDPFALAGAAVFPEGGAGHGGFQQPGAAEHIGDAAGTIEAMGRAAVASAISIRSGLDFIGGGDRTMHGGGGASGGDHLAVGEDGARAVVVVLGGAFGRGAADQQGQRGQEEETEAQHG